MSAWLDFVTRWKDCTKCPLHQQRGNIVLARGEIPADVVFVGEAPGASEDAHGVPFVKGAPAGGLLQQIVDRAVPTGMSVAYCNLVCCYPRDAKARGDNEPEVSEIRDCRPRLDEFIRLCKPKLIVCVGTLASDYIGHDAHGKVMGAAVVDIVHPAFIIARLPLAQKGMAVNKCIVTIRSAIEDMVQSV